MTKTQLFSLAVVLFFGYKFIVKDPSAKKPNIDIEIAGNLNEQDTADVQASITSILGLCNKIGAKELFSVKANLSYVDPILKKDKSLVTYGWDREVYVTAQKAGDSHVHHFAINPDTQEIYIYKYTTTELCQLWQFKGEGNLMCTKSNSQYRCAKS